MHSTKKLLLLFTFIGGLFSCAKNDPDPVDPIPPSEYVPIYFPCDTSLGFAFAKKQGVEWASGATCLSYFFEGKKEWSIQMLTCAEDGSFRENFIIGAITDEHPIGNYPVSHASSSLPFGHVGTAYSTSSDDGDIPEDLYKLDTTATTNYFIVDHWDTVNKRADGRFNLTFNIKEPRKNPKNPKKVTFSSGRFRVKIP